VSGITLTCHAAQRVALMGLTPREIDRAWRDPEVTYPGRPTKRGTTRIALRDGLAVVGSSDGTVITVLWRNAEGRDVTGRPLPSAHAPDEPCCSNERICR